MRLMLERNQKLREGIEAEALHVMDAR